MPAKTVVMMCLTPIHLDCAHFESPLAFSPSRFLDGSEKTRHPYAFLPFGAGPRSCLGGRLATQELVLTLVRLFGVATFELGPGQEPLANREGITNVPARGVHVRVMLR